MSDDFQRELQDWQTQATTALTAWLPTAGVPERLQAAIRHSLDAGGKRLRPVLILATASRGAQPGPNASAAAAAIEFLHTYTLIHDDLPAMDNSDMRRGRPTCHIAFDEATAILAGDALQAQAFEALTRGYADDPALALGLLTDLAQAASSSGVVGGQQLDLEAEGQTNLALADLERIHRGKTGALFAASLAMGSRLAGHDVATVDEASAIGYDLGLAFQIVDDLLDATASEAQLGKPTGQDEINHKHTYVAALGREGAQARAEAITASIIDRIQLLDTPSGFLQNLCRWLLSRDH